MVTPDEEQSFLVDYVYGPCVGRVRVNGPTAAKAVNDLWLTLQAQYEYMPECTRSYKVVKDLDKKTSG